MTFAFADDEWRLIAAELAAVGRLDSGGERATLETIAHWFTSYRTKRGKGRPTPKKARECWIQVAEASERLNAAIAALGEAGAANFTVLDDHSDSIKAWAAALPWIAREARVVAEIEMHRPKPSSNNADPERDFFLQQIISTWKDYGGQVRTSTHPQTHEPGGPLIRFASLVAEPAFRSIGEQPPTPEIIRQAARKYRNTRMVSSATE